MMASTVDCVVVTGGKDTTDEDGEAEKYVGTSCGEKKESVNNLGE
jgi:hypothetical protein